MQPYKFIFQYKNLSLARNRLSEVLQRLEGYSGPQKALPASLDKFIESNDNINAIDLINQIQELVAVKFK